MSVDLNRRALLKSAAFGAAASAVAPSIAFAAQDARITAVAFDAFPIFDARPIFRMCEHLFAERGAELAQMWRTRQFEYQWLRALGGRYVNFWDATRDALVFAAASLHVDMTDQQRDILMNGYLQLQAWPDVKPALLALRSLGLKIAFLSNATRGILQSGIENSSLQGAFDAVISTDQIRSFKPDARAYALGAETLGQRKEEILFVAFAGWDVAGGKWFGYPTFWNNRQSATQEQLGAVPDASGATLNELVSYVRTRLAS
jgi:2-haloacid dehalogenase